MDFTSQDIVMIEKALHFAIQHETSEQVKRNYREVLQKLQASAHDAIHAKATGTPPLEGFRYDYDDSSELP